MGTPSEHLRRIHDAVAHTLDPGVEREWGPYPAYIADLLRVVLALSGEPELYNDDDDDDLEDDAA